MKLDNWGTMPLGVLFPKSTSQSGNKENTTLVSTIFICSDLFCRDESSTKLGLGFYLHCESQCNDLDPEWYCTASAELSIKSHKTDVPDFSRELFHDTNFNSRTKSWGFYTFRTMEVQCLV